MNYAWMTDIHLNFLHQPDRINFYKIILETKNLNGLFITGDIAEGSSVCKLLAEMAEYIKQPLYFVLGNHDYYRSDINTVKKDIRNLCNKNKLLHWLPCTGPTKLNTKTVLLGQDGWADGRYGDFMNSSIELNDSRYIRDLMGLSKTALLSQMQLLADSDSLKLQENIKLTISVHHPKKIIVLTHIPPFEAACCHEGKQSDPFWMPYFSSKATGDVLLSMAEKNPDTQFLVLCGHTHSKGYAKPLDNLEVKAGSARYKHPEIQENIYIK